MNKNRANEDGLQDEEKIEAYSHFKTQDTTITLILELVSRNKYKPLICLPREIKHICLKPLQRLRIKHALLLQLNTFYLITKAS